jgi:cytosine/adenosine deaminase-related metal-dependent hydrolase
VGKQLQVPEGTAEIDASGGIVLPGMIDTHRYCRQAAGSATWARQRFLMTFLR